jgi:hypothetical protein
MKSDAVVQHQSSQHTSVVPAEPTKYELEVSFHSVRKAVIGSTLVARRAGR